MNIFKKNHDTIKEYRYHDLYMRIAFQCAEMSYAKRLKVGAVAVKDGRIISMGWNGMPKGYDNTCEVEDEDGNLITKDEVLHAEHNLIVKLAKSPESSENCIVYLTHNPCFNCAKSLLTAGIKTIYYRNHYRCDTGVNFLESNGVHIERIR